jgi:malonyl-CoA O-methyltransferase
MDSVFLRREIALRMHERLALVRLTPQQVLDAGCGDAPDLLALQKCYVDAQIIGLDASLGMLKAAQKNYFTAGSAVSRLLKKIMPAKSVRERSSGLGLVCGNFAQLPFDPNKFDLVWSNLALHWHPQPDQVFSEWRRVLRVDGLLMFSCFGPDTFKELRTAFAILDGLSHALPFVDMHDFGDMLVDAGFSTPVMDMETITVTYDSVEKLLADVRACGGNPLATRRRSLVTGTAWKRVMEGLERMRGSNGKIPLTFEVIYGHAFKPVPRVTSQGEAIVRLDLKKK